MWVGGWPYSGFGVRPGATYMPGGGGSEWLAMEKPVEDDSEGREAVEKEWLWPLCPLGVFWWPGKRPCAEPGGPLMCTSPAGPLLLLVGR